MHVVIALGGNALSKRGEPLTAAHQKENVRRAAAAIAPIASRHRVTLTHGNGPQVGLLALQSESYAASVEPYPLDVLGAESEGMIGYLLELELRRAMPGRSLATLLTMVEVDPEDEAFARPTKPIGPVYTEEEASRVRTAHSWTLARDGAGWRRVVASPEPVRIVGLDVVRSLTTSGVTVVCAGGGGIPVARGEGGALSGVEAVVDKDLASGLLAAALDADFLVLATDVDGVYRDWARSDRERIEHARPSELRAQSFEAGTMGPKVESACRFVEADPSGSIRRARIGALDELELMVLGSAGTLVAQGGS